MSIDIRPIKILFDTNIPGKQLVPFTKSLLYNPELKDTNGLDEYPNFTMDVLFPFSYLNSLSYEKQVTFFFNKSEMIKVLKIYKSVVFNDSNNIDEMPEILTIGDQEIIKKETSRIIEKSGCSYLEDLLTCVHIAQLKILSSIRTGKSQKKVEIDIPKLNGFIHKVYIHISRELYASVYLFEKGIPPLVFQQNRSKVNEIIKESILNAIRDSIPVEQLLRAYLDETTDFMKEVPKEEPKEEKKELKFSDKDSAITVNNEAMVIEAPKDVDTLEKIAEQRNIQRKAEEAAEAEEDKVKISEEVVVIDVEELTPVKVEIPEKKEPEIDIGIEILA